MNRKNAFSYFIWFLYAAVVCVGLLSITSVFGKQLGQTAAVGMIVGGVWILLCGVITLLIHKLMKHKEREIQIGKMPAIVAESLVAVLLFAAGLILRISCMGNVGEESVYFELTKVAEGQMIPAVVHGAVYIYLQLLHLVYLVFGNIFVAGIWLQIVLQIIAAIFLYLAVRKPAGAVSSLVMLGFFMLSPTMINAALVLSPQSLFLMVFAIAIWGCVKCICDRKGIIPCIFAGLLISVACYLDVLGIVLLAFSVVGILLVMKDTEESGKRRVLGALLCVLSCVIGFVLLILVDSLASAKQMADVLFAWWNVFAPSAFEMSLLADAGLLSVEALIVLVLMAFGIFSFWSVRKTERQSLWTVAMLAIILLQGFGMITDEVDGSIFGYIMASVLAGVSVTGMFCREATVCGNAWEDGRLEAQLEAMSQDIEEALAVSEEVVVDVKVDVDIPSPEEPQAEMPQVKFIENPLPLPKKHVKKVLDFDYEIKDGMDDFDIDVADDDDFDV